MSLIESDSAKSGKPGVPFHETLEESPNGSNSKPEALAIYGSFWIGDLEFALPVSAIREVVNEPAVTSTVPLAPSFLKGLFNLRGLAIPIVDLRTLLELPDTEILPGGSKVAIIENHDKCVGVLFDRAGEVLNKPSSAHVNFRASEDSNSGAVIDGVLTLDDGNRMVQTIDPYRLIHMERVPQTEVADFRTSHQRNLGKRLSCVSFKFGHTHCAIDLRYVQEVKEMPPIDKSPLAHGCVIGTVVLRGIVIPVVDFRSFMGSEPPSDPDLQASKSRKLLVMQTDGGLIGLMVLSIDSIIPFFENDVVPFAKLALPRSKIVKGSLTDKSNEVVLLLDHDELRAEPDLAGAAKSCREVHTSIETEVETTKAASASERKTFILFSLGNCFAMDSEVVTEIINVPEKLLKPTYAMNFVEGIIHLRGELITLINLRSVYGLENDENDEHKVLIFTHDGQKYAIMVDSVDEIITTTADNISTTEVVGYPTISSPASKDVSGVLHCSRSGQENQMIMIMDGGALVARCAKTIN